MGCLSSRAYWCQTPFKSLVSQLKALYSQTKQADYFLSFFILKLKVLLTFLEKKLLAYLTQWWLQQYYNHFPIWLFSTLFWCVTKKSGKLSLTCLLRMASILVMIGRIYPTTSNIFIQKTKYFLCFLLCTLNFEHFQKNNEPGCSKHVNKSQKLVKSVQNQF